MDFSKDDKYLLQGMFDGVNVYILAEANEYHMSRYIEASNQQIFASAGMTKEKLKAVTDEIIRICNEEVVKTVRTDVGALANLLQYYMKYPVDEQCAIKMGCVLSFIDGEDPNKVNPLMEQKKLQLAIDNPDAYTFFLTWGKSNIPEYREAFDTSISLDYFSRTEQARMLLPSSLRHIA